MALDRGRHDSHLDDDDKLLDVVGPSQSPLLPLSHSLQQLQAHPHSGKLHFFPPLPIVILLSSIS